MQDSVYEVLMKLPKKNLINTLWAALDIMQGYNGHSRTYCILDALGFKCLDYEAERRTFERPTLKQIKENTESMGF